MANFCNVYEVYDKKGNFLARGIGRKLRPFLDNVHENLINAHSKRGTFLKGKWKIVPVDKVYVREMDNVETVISEELKKYYYDSMDEEGENKKTLDYLISHLERYDNTVLNEDPERFIPILRENGYDCTYRKVLGLRHEKGRDAPFYILEVKGILRKEEDLDD